MKSLSIILLLITSIITTQAQTMPEVEQQIKTYLDSISYWRFEYSAEDTSFDHEVSSYDSLLNVNQQLTTYIINTAQKQTLLLKQEIKSFKNYDISIVTSEDKKLRLISWNTYTGGTQHANEVIAIYNKNGSIKTAQLGELKSETRKYGTGYYNGIHTITTKSQKTYYLTIYIHILSNSIANGGIVAYSLDDGIINEIELFHANSGSYSRIEYEYDYMSNFDFEEMGENYAIHLNKKKLYIPLVIGEQMSGKWLVYVFDGEKFIYNKKTK